MFDLPSSLIVGVIRRFKSATDAQAPSQSSPSDTEKGSDRLRFIGVSNLLGLDPTPDIDPKSIKIEKSSPRRKKEASLKEEKERAERIDQIKSVSSSKAQEKANEWISELVDEYLPAFANRKDLMKDLMRNFYRYSYKNMSDRKSVV